MKTKGLRIIDFTWKTLTLVGMVSLLGSGCASAPEPAPFLNVQGARVKVVAAPEVKDCRSIGLITSERSGDFETVENRIYTVTVDIRNKAGARGATHLVLMPPITEPEVQRSGDAYICP